jgi:hypothetical protein
MNLMHFDRQRVVCATYELVVLCLNIPNQRTQTKQKQQNNVPAHDRRRQRASPTTRHARLASLASCTSAVRCARRPNSIRSVVRVESKGRRESNARTAPCSSNRAGGRSNRKQHRHRPTSARNKKRQRGKPLANYRTNLEIQIGKTTRRVDEKRRAQVQCLAIVSDVRMLKTLVVLAVRVVAKWSISKIPTIIGDKRWIGPRSHARIDGRPQLVVQNVTVEEDPLRTVCAESTHDESHQLRVERRWHAEKDLHRRFRHETGDVVRRRDARCEHGIVREHARGQVELQLQVVVEVQRVAKVVPNVESIAKHLHAENAWQWLRKQTRAIGRREVAYAQLDVFDMAVRVARRHCVVRGDTIERHESRSSSNKHFLCRAPHFRAATMASA